MFSKSWVKLIILLFLGTIIPLIFNNYVFAVVEGNVALSKACASGTGAVGACAAIGGAAAQAKAAADLAKATKATKATAVAPATVGKNNEETEEASDFAESFTVNNDRTNEFAYAYITESFVEGAAVKKAPAADSTVAPSQKSLACKITSRLISYKDDHTKLKRYINGPMTTWHNNRCK